MLSAPAEQPQPEGSYLLIADKLCYYWSFISRVWPVGASCGSSRLFFPSIPAGDFLPDCLSISLHTHTHTRFERASSLKIIHPSESHTHTHKPKHWNENCEIKVFHISLTFMPNNIHTHTHTRHRAVFPLNQNSQTKTDTGAAACWHCRRAVSVFVLRVTDLSSSSYDFSSSLIQDFSVHPLLPLSPPQWHVVLFFTKQQHMLYLHLKLPFKFRI